MCAHLGDGHKSQLFISLGCKFNQFSDVSSYANSCPVHNSCPLKTALILSSLKNCHNKSERAVLGKWTAKLISFCSWSSACPVSLLQKLSYILSLYHYYWLCCDIAGPMTSFNIQAEFCGGGLRGAAKQTGRRDRIHYSGPSAACSCYRFAHSISQPVK